MLFKPVDLWRLAALLSLLLMPWTPAAHGADNPLPELIKRVSPAIVTILSYREEVVMPSVGTGFLVAHDRVMTARHCLARADRGAVRTADGRTIAIAGILAEDRASDLVLLELEKPIDGPTPLVASSKPPEVGERLLAIGAPLGFEFTASSGIVSAYREVTSAGTLMQHTVAVSPGSSGCPLLNERGEAVAIQTGTITTGSSLVSAGESLHFAASAQRAFAMKPGKLRSLPACKNDVPVDWVPPITKGVESVSLYALTREDFAAALPFFEQCAREDPSNADAWFRVGLCQEHIGQKREAAVAYRKSLDLKPEQPIVLNNMGAVSISLGEYPNAIRSLKQATQLRPENASAWGNLAVAAIEQKDWPTAIQAAKQALHFDDNNAEAHLNLGTACVHTNDRTEAKRQLEILNKLDHPRAERLKALLDAESPAPSEEQKVNK